MNRSRTFFSGILAVAAAAGFLLASSSAHAEFVRGEINSWGSADFMTSDTDFGNIWKATIAATNTDATSEFKFDRYGTWVEQNWGSAAGSVTAVKNTSPGLAKYNGGSNGNLSFSQNSGDYYSFSMDGESTFWDRNYVVMETDSAPVTIPNVWHDTGAGGGTVHIQLSASKSAQESVWVRASTDMNFGTSSLVPASGSGTNYTATLSGYSSGSTVYYYVLTSTMPSNEITSDYDLCTLMGKKDGSSNYNFNVGATFGIVWHYPTNSEPVGHTMREPVLPSSDDAVTCYIGNYQPFATMSGGTFYWRNASGGSWSNASLNYFSGSSTNTFYYGTIPADQFSNGDTVEYYFLANYLTVADPTYLGTSNGTDNTKYETQGEAESNPFSFTYQVTLGNSWHLPMNEEPSGARMRNPTNPAADEAVFFYNGTYTNDHNQTGGSLYYRESGGSWTNVALSFDSNNGSGNQYWVANIPADTYSGGTTIEYCFLITYSNADDTHIGTTNGGAGYVLYESLAEAQADPFSFTYGAATLDLGNAWHLPANTEPPGVYMRNPPNAFSNNAVYFYNGNQFQGIGTIGDQSGGALYHRLSGGGGWTATNLAFDSQQGNNKYWLTSIPGGTYDASDTVEYYFGITYTDRDTTYIGTTNGGAGSITYGVEASAQANPFSFTYGGEPGTEAGYMWHNSNRVVQGSGTVQFWVQIGYAQGEGTDKWVDNAVLYYTTNGASVGVTGKGTGDANTMTAPMTFSHTDEQESDENGNAMWWQVTVTNLPTSGNIKYKIGSWNGAGTQRFAEYNTDGIDNKEFVFSLFVSGADGLTVNGLNADYTTSKFFVDERAGDSHTVTVNYTIPGVTPVDKVEVFSNLDRRDFADVDINSDSIPDGIKPPLGNSISTNDTGAYFRAYPMAHQGGRTYQWIGTASKAGAYRLTARYMLSGDTNWYWYSSDGRRDHAIVVSPKKALEMTLYEVNPLTVKATFNDKNGRSTFDDLLEGNQDSFTNFNLGYLNKIQVNSLWFQPIHPSAVTTRGDPSGYEPGSPYATRDYFAVAQFLGRDDTEAGAMSEFTNFVYHCDTYTGSVGTVNIMLDGVFNHTAWDAEMGQGGVDLGFVASPNDSMPGTRPGWYSYWQDYGEPANFYNDVYDNDIAVAPDRGDFGKWLDTADLYFGKYSALVRHNPDNNGDYLNESDVYDFGGMTSDTVDLWKYFAYYTEFWLKKTGHPTNNLSAAYDDFGIDALRCDFGQGLPPQLWEYIINRTRKMKWNFVFMAETLDGGVPGYRSNRHFDILNESIVFNFTAAQINESSQLKSALEDRRNAYNGGAILLNLTGHDEIMPDNDTWVTASRYAAVSAIDGLPMIFYGQEQGIQRFNPLDIDNKNDGFLHSHEQNFGKWIPHFKQWNKLTVWEQPPDNSDGLAQWYGRVNWARHNSPALRSQNRYFLNKVGGGTENSIFAVAKYETPYASPTNSDVVLAFSLFLRHGEAHFGAGATYDLQGAWDLLGLDTGKTYRIRNLASSDAYAYISSGWPRTGQDLWDNGIYVYMGGGTVNPITDDGELVQYLKIEEAPPVDNSAPVISLPGPHILPVGSATNFPIGVTDVDSDPVTTNVTVSPAGSTFIGGIFSWTPGAAFENTTNEVRVVSDDQQGETNSVVTNSTVIVVPFDSDLDGLGDGWEWNNFMTLTNTPDGDNDGDGSSNSDEYNADTSPTNALSVFEVVEAESSGATIRHIRVSTQPGKKYTIYYADGPVENDMTWTAFANPAQGIGTFTENGGVPSTFIFQDKEDADSTGGPPASGLRNYRVIVSEP